MKAKPILDLMNASSSINDCVKNSMPYLVTYELYQDFRDEDKSHVQSIIECLEGQLAHMLCIMQKIPAHKHQSIKVQTINGNYVSASGYMAVMHRFSTMLKLQLSKSFKKI